MTGKKYHHQYKYKNISINEEAMYIFKAFIYTYSIYVNVSRESYLSSDIKKKKILYWPFNVCLFLNPNCYEISLIKIFC